MRATRSARLSAAVAAGLLATAMAPTAMADEPVQTTSRDTASVVSADATLTFETATGYDATAENVQVTIAPAESAQLGGDGPTDTKWTVYKAAGEETPAAFSYDAETDRGTVDVAEARRALGETGPVIVSIYVDGGFESADATAVYDADAVGAGALVALRRRAA